MEMHELRLLLEGRDDHQVVCCDWTKGECFPLSSLPDSSYVRYSGDTVVLLDFYSGEYGVTAKQLRGVLDGYDLEGSDGNMVLLFAWTKDAIFELSQPETLIAEFKGKPAIVLRCEYIGNHDRMVMPVFPTDRPPSRWGDADFFNDFPGEGVRIVSTPKEPAEE